MKLKNSALAMTILASLQIHSLASAQSQSASQQKAGVAPQKQIPIYYFHPEGYPAGVVSEHIEVEEVDGRWSIKGLEGGTIGATMPLTAEGTAKPTYFPDALGSKDTHIVINPKTGYTRLAGLKFLQEAVVNIWDNGAVEVNQEGVEAIDDAGYLVVSKKVVLKGQSTIAMVKTGKKYQKPFLYVSGTLVDSKDVPLGQPHQFVVFGIKEVRGDKVSAIMLEETSNPIQTDEKGNFNIKVEITPSIKGRHIGLFSFPTMIILKKTDGTLFLIPVPERGQKINLGKIPIEIQKN